MRIEPHALRAQLRGELHVVEDLAVLHDRDLSVVRDEGLVAAGEVDDREAPVADGHAALALVPDALVVGTAVHEAGRHGGELALAEGAPAAVPVAEDAAHGASCSRGP